MYDKVLKYQNIMAPEACMELQCLSPFFPVTVYEHRMEWPHMQITSSRTAQLCLQSSLQKYTQEFLDCLHGVIKQKWALFHTTLNRKRFLSVKINVFILFDIKLKRVIAILREGALFTVCLVVCRCVPGSYSTILMQRIFSMKSELLVKLTELEIRVPFLSVL